MMDKGIKAIYVRLTKKDGGLRVVTGKIPIEKVFNCGNALAPGDLVYNFESVYEPYQKYAFEDIDCIDLVVNGGGKALSPLGVKLTVLPTDATSRAPEKDWGCEMVIRPATTTYCALGMYDSVARSARKIRGIFEDTCSAVEKWDSEYEMSRKIPELSRCVDEFQNTFLRHQKPLVMQTIWKTRGKSPLLADNAFDIVVWSDYAFSRLFVDESYEAKEKMSRPMRATARLARCLWELGKSGKIHLPEIYRQMAFQNQTDKEFAIAGKRWRKYVSSSRIVRPVLPREVVHDVIGKGYLEKLSPERRFDQTLYFTMQQ